MKVCESTIKDQPKPVILLGDSKGPDDAVANESKDTHTHGVHARDQTAHVLMILQSGVSIDEWDIRGNGRIFTEEHRSSRITEDLK
mgnify:CR=1 FL=1